MHLFNVMASPNCKKVRVAARELDLPLTLIPLDLQKPRTPEHLARNATGKVPTLIDDDFVLWESGAILVYLARKRPGVGLLPADPRDEADVLHWLFFLATHLQPWVSMLGQERVMKPRRGEPPDANAIALAERELARFLPVVDGALERRELLATSGTFTIADIAVGCGLESLEQRGVSLAPYAGLAAWIARLRARPSWQD